MFNFLYVEHFNSDPNMSRDKKIVLSRHYRHWSQGNLHLMCDKIVVVFIICTIIKVLTAQRSSMYIDLDDEILLLDKVSTGHFSLDDPRLGM